MDDLDEIVWLDDDSVEIDEIVWQYLTNQLQEIGGKQHMDKKLEKVVDEEAQILSLFHMGMAEFEEVIVEYKKRLDTELMHSKAKIAQLEQDKITLIRKNVELNRILNRTFESLEGMIKEWRKSHD